MSWMSEEWQQRVGRLTGQYNYVAPETIKGQIDMLVSFSQSDPHRSSLLINPTRQNESDMSCRPRHPD